MTLTPSVFSRLLALVYLIAFVSLWVQLDGLIGSNGILPAAELMKAAAERIPGRFDLMPTLAWISASDAFLHGLCAAGVVCSLLALIGVAESVSFFLLWLLYLSLVSVSREFLSFQWDNLLLETGFLTVFLSSFSFKPGLTRNTSPPTMTLWLLRWLLFRLMFESGIVKLLSGDPAWKDLTALQYHFETQPLPTWIGWYAHQLPSGVLKAATAAMFAIELVVPFLIFFGRRCRIAAATIFIGFQFIIALTGNYCFFNLLTAVLCLLLLDDRFLRREPRFLKPSKFAFIASIPLAVFVVTVSGSQLAAMVGAKIWGRGAMPELLVEAATFGGSFRTVNRYGLFAVMTKSRSEIVVEGSRDGVDWRPYEFKWKPGPTDHRPRFVAPYQPRLDWQMWFAALGRCENNPWLQRFLKRLLEGSPPVLRLLKANPFPDGPPAQIRTRFFDYHFTDFETRSRDGSWWRRNEIGIYCPTFQR